MKLSLKKFKGTNVYFMDSKEPWGTVDDIIWDLETKKAVALKIKTLSLIPITKIIPIDCAEIFYGKKPILKTTSNNNDFTPEENLTTSSLNRVLNSDLTRKHLKDIHFDFETGLISDVIVSKNIIAGNHKVSINKISLKDNTIYIEK